MYLTKVLTAFNHDFMKHKKKNALGVVGMLKLRTWVSSLVRIARTPYDRYRLGTCVNMLDQETKPLQKLA